MAEHQINGGPAFPVEWDDCGERMAVTGMTLLDWFAGQALPAVFAAAVAQPVSIDSPTVSDIAVKAYQVADAMLAQRGIRMADGPTLVTHTHQQSSDGAYCYTAPVGNWVVGNVSIITDGLYGARILQSTDHGDVLVAVSYGSTSTIAHANAQQIVHAMATARGHS
jgi:hypothetical protein